MAPITRSSESPAWYERYVEKWHASMRLRAKEEAAAARRERIGLTAATFSRVLLMLLVIFLVMSALAIFLPALATTRSGRRPSSQNTMKQWGLVFKMYSNEDEGERFPPRAEGLWVPDLRVLLPEYVTDPDILTSPRLNDDAPLEEVTQLATQKPPDWGALQKIMAENFIYTGYALVDAEAIRAFDAALQKRDNPDFREDIEEGETTFYRLRDGIEGFFMSQINDAKESIEAQSRLPILVENSFVRDIGRNPPGANVLYLDGHVDYVTVEQEPEYFAALEELLDFRSQEE
jgi:prepilin-type processing-associated H-X9-DG protein